LKTLKLDDFVGKLLTHQIHLQEKTEKPTTEQGLALESNIIELQIEESENDEDETLAIIAKGFKKDI